MTNYENKYNQKLILEPDLHNLMFFGFFSMFFQKKRKKKEKILFLLFLRMLQAIRRRRILVSHVINMRTQLR